jgi:hypothetical protein
MARADLKNLLLAVEEQAKRDNSYRKSLDRKPHKHLVDLNSLKEEAKNQIIGTFVASQDKVTFNLSGVDTEIDIAVFKYYSSLYSAYSKYKPVKYVKDLKTLSLSSFQFTLENLEDGGTGSVFDRIHDIRSGPLKELKNNLYKIIIKSNEYKTQKATASSQEDKSHIKNSLVNRIYGVQYEQVITDKKTGETITRKARTSGIFEKGHIEGQSVIEKETQDDRDRLFEALDKYLPQTSIGSVREELIAKFGISAKTNPSHNVLKEIEIEYITLIDQGSQANNAQSQKERKVREILQQAAKHVLTRIPLALQKGSNNAVTVAAGKFTKSSKKAGAKVSDPSLITIADKQDKTPEQFIGIYSKIVETASKESLVSKTSPKKRNKKVASSNEQNMPNWYSLIGIINAKLPERVANNMGAPGLVYRTGRFANSTKVVNVETTKDGYPSVIFDYQRNPYDVFDRTKGASPWNTPARDPRALVDKSVREIVQEMAIGRFYTRRA